MKFKSFNLFASAALAVAALCSSPVRADRPDSDGPNSGDAKDHEFDGKMVIGHRLNNGGAAGPVTQALTQAGIQYHGGPVLLGQVNVYVIWYGTWSATSKSILTVFLNNLGGSPYWNINTSYTSSAGVKISNSLKFLGSTIDTGTATSLSDANIQTITANAISSGRLPNDPNGIYLVLTGSNVTASSGFCTQYCGWHTHATISGTDIKYAFIGSVSRCPSSCAAQNPGPNGDINADGGASIIAHELEETVTDPDLNAWWQTSTGMENGDKCAWTFGTTTGVAPAKYNMILGGKKFLIQQNWLNSGTGSCKLVF